MVGLFHGQSHLEMDDLGVPEFQETFICILKTQNTLFNFVKSSTWRRQLQPGSSLSTFDTCTAAAPSIESFSHMTLWFLGIGRCASIYQYHALATKSKQRYHMGFQSVIENLISLLKKKKQHNSNPNSIVQTLLQYNRYFFLSNIPMWPQLHRLARDRFHHESNLNWQATCRFKAKYLMDVASATNGP